MEKENVLHKLVFDRTKHVNWNKLTLISAGAGELCTRAEVKALQCGEVG